MQSLPNMEVSLNLFFCSFVDSSVHLFTRSFASGDGSPIILFFLFHTSVAVVVQATHRRSEDPAIPKPRQKASPVSRRKWATFIGTVFRPIMQSVPYTPLQLSHWPAICPSTRSNGRSIWRPMTSKYYIQTNAGSLEQIYFVILTSSCSLIPNVDSVSRQGKCRLMETDIRPIYFWRKKNETRITVRVLNQISKCMQSSKERYLLGQKTACEFRCNALYQATKRHLNNS